MKIGFDNEKYLKMQSEHIRERIGQFDNKLYLEFGGKLFDDFHASRVLPGFQPDKLGKETIDTNTYARSFGRNGNYSTNYQISGRELMTFVKRRNRGKNY